MLQNVCPENHVNEDTQRRYVTKQRSRIFVNLVSVVDPEASGQRDANDDSRWHVHVTGNERVPAEHADCRNR